MRTSTGQSRALLAVACALVAFQLLKASQQRSAEAASTGVEAARWGGGAAQHPLRQPTDGEQSASTAEQATHFEKLAPGEREKVVILDPKVAGQRAREVAEALKERADKQQVRLVEEVRPDGSKITYEIVDELIEDDDGEDEAEAGEEVRAEPEVAEAKVAEVKPAAEQKASEPQTKSKQAAGRAPAAQALEKTPPPTVNNTAVASVQLPPASATRDETPPASPQPTPEQEQKQRQKQEQRPSGGDNNDNNTNNSEAEDAVGHTKPAVASETPPAEAREEQRKSADASAPQQQAAEATTVAPPTDDQSPLAPQPTPPDYQDLTNDGPAADGAPVDELGAARRPGRVAIKGVANKKRKVVDKLEKNLLTGPKGDNAASELFVEDSGNETEELIKDRKINELPAEKKSAPNSSRPPPPKGKTGKKRSKGKAKSKKRVDAKKPENNESEVPEELDNQQDKDRSEVEKEVPGMEAEPKKDGSANVDEDGADEGNGGRESGDKTPVESKKGKVKKKNRKGTAQGDEAEDEDVLVKEEPEEVEKKATTERSDGKKKPEESRDDAAKQATKKVRKKSRSMKGKKPEKLSVDANISADLQKDSPDNGDDGNDENEDTDVETAHADDKNMSAQQVPPTPQAISAQVEGGSTASTGSSGGQAVLQPKPQAIHTVQTIDKSGGAKANELNFIQPGSQTIVQPGSTSITTNEQQHGVADPNQQTVVIEERTTQVEGDEDDLEEESDDLDEGGGRRRRRRRGHHGGRGWGHGWGHRHRRRGRG